MIVGRSEGSSAATKSMLEPVADFAVLCEKDVVHVETGILSRASWNRSEYFHSYVRCLHQWQLIKLNDNFWEERRPLLQ